MLYMVRILPVVAGLLLPVHAHGNGATASFPAGGVEFKDSTNIAIAREDLYLSPGEVRVDYVFHSIAEYPSTEIIAFPLPRVLSTFDSPASVQDRENASGDMRNYLDFGVAVNGRPIIPVLHEFAWLGDENVTAEILAAGLPLLPRYEQWEAAVAELDPATFEALVASGLIADWDVSTEPRWDYQVIYEWQQTFAPGDTSVSIHYRPLLGWPTDYSQRGRYFEGELAEAVCVDDAFRQKINALLDSKHTYSVAELDYVTTTARHWLGAIQQFNLTVAAIIPDEWDWSEDDMANSRVLVSLCPDDVSTDENNDRHWTVSDYVPERDIHVLFYIFAAY